MAEDWRNRGNETADDDCERAEAEQDAYEAWCEDNDLDPDEDHSVEWEDYCDDMRESAAERRAEEREDMERFGEW